MKFFVVGASQGPLDRPGVADYGFNVAIGSCSSHDSGVLIYLKCNGIPLDLINLKHCSTGTHIQPLDCDSVHAFRL